MSTNKDADFICSTKWKDGLILIISYMIVKLHSPFLLEKTVIGLILRTFIAYCVIYGIVAWPFLLVSFLQPITTCTFLHTFLLIILSEFIFRKFI